MNSCEARNERHSWILELARMIGLKVFAKQRHQRR